MESIGEPRAMGRDEILATLAEIERSIGARLRTCRIDAGTGEPLRRVATGFGVLHAVYTAKVRSITATLLHSISSREFLAFASAGRMLLEHYAILLYYGREKIRPLLEHGSPVGIAEEKAKALGRVLDQFLSGHRHDWGPLLRAHFPADLVARRESRQQVNILTCLEKWDRAEPGVKDLYGMFCDMVHPNAGSLFLFLHREGDDLVAADPHRASVADAIVEQTAPRLIAILQRVPPILDQLAQAADAAAWAATRSPPSR